ncbi:MAG: hypothetical protein ACRCU9_06840, partial [Iodobacter sp.]
PAKRIRRRLWTSSGYRFELRGARAVILAAHHRRAWIHHLWRRPHYSGGFGDVENPWSLRRMKSYRCRRG